MSGQFNPFGSDMMLAQLMQDMQVRLLILAFVLEEEKGWLMANLGSCWCGVTLEVNVDSVDFSQMEKY